MLVNLAVITALAAVGVPALPAVIVGIAVSMVTNFLLNRRFTFSYARAGSIRRQFVGFVMAAAAGAAVNLATTLLISTYSPKLPIQVAALCGIAVGMVLNYVSNQFLNFRHKGH